MKQLQCKNTFKNICTKAWGSFYSTYKYDLYGLVCIEDMFRYEMTTQLIEMKSVHLFSFTIE